MFTSFVKPEIRSVLELMMSVDTKKLPKIPESHLDVMQGIQGMLTTIRHKDGMPSTNPIVYDYDGEFVRISG